MPTDLSVPLEQHALKIAQELADVLAAIEARHRRAFIILLATHCTQLVSACDRDATVTIQRLQT